MSLKLNGFRRFDDARIDLAPRVVAIVGPNQAGKSSLLDALLSLGDAEPFPFADLTRTRAQRAPEEVVLSAWYRLDESDRDAIADIHPAVRVDGLISFKRVNGSLTHQTSPYLRRDVAARNATLNAMSAALELLDTEMDDEGVTVSRLRTVLASDTQTLSQADADAIQGARDAIAVDVPVPLSVLRERLTTALEREVAIHPHQRAVSALVGRIPGVVLFGDEERNLLADYDLHSQADDPPAALRNLAAIARLNLVELREAVARADAGAVATIQEATDHRLADFFERAWSQAKITVSLRSDGMKLSVLVKTTGGRWASIAESSDGLRQFVALVAFAAKQPLDPKPVFVIDEAERHLHYEAQADLVRVLERQEQASSVIYTTHSAGCLPQDLGRGIRVVEQSTTMDHSSITNALWKLGPGFSPLIMAMGASTLAFSTTRYAVMGEGGTEMLLLPTLLREATGLVVLPFQVAPGLAEVSRQAMTDLDLTAARVAYFLDGDESGRVRAAVLTAAGIPSQLIIRLPADVCLEDVVDGGAYREAINAIVLERHGPGFAIPASDIPRTGRARAVDAWCGSHGIPAPSHPEVAARLLDLRPDGPLVEGRRRITLQKLYDALSVPLGLPKLADLASG